MASLADNRFWFGQKVLITGHTGFKGVWLTRLLETLGAEVYGLALAPPAGPNLFSLAETRWPRGGRSVIGDMLAPGRLASALRESRATVAFHLAAQSLVGQSFLDPEGTFAANVMGTVKFLEAARQAPALKAAVVVTSDKCYRNDGRLSGYVEADPLGGDDPYSASKGAAELAVTAWRHSFFQAGSALLASARAGNVIGGGDFAPDRLAPDALRAFADGRPLLLRRPGAVRPWQHVLEPLSGYLALARGLGEGRRDWAGGWNFGPGPDGHWPVSRLAGRLAELWGEEARVDFSPAASYQEAERLSLNAGLARTELPWAPRLTLDETLAWTVDWYRAFYRGGQPLETFQQQIDAYLARPVLP
ncbi:MAG: CDP-glucose 4,6-dehydratase [Candidatus Adiutrix sp.]|jgi:CDP-glucose 4,6-dehydratase|nr:CDP-glucose 4,6-dehydratase [Candidatus Adiutrix sp.]